MSYPIPDLYDFLRGPGFIISISVFISGFIYRLVRLILATRKIRMYGTGSENNFPSGSLHFEGFLLKKITNIQINIRNTILATHPAMGIITLFFHILLFITPLFLTAHNIISDLTIGVSLFTLSERLSDTFTILLISIGGFFLARRIFIPRVRVISTVRDYLMLLFVMSPFVSAFIAYHHFFNYHVVIFIHMIIGEIAIMAVPFTGLVHMPFIIFSRFFIDSEYSIIPGNRGW